MALSGKVRPDCNYSSNPYHECTETCLRRIAEGKGRKDKKRADNGRSFNKRYEEKIGNSRACPKASNPYHECNDNCLRSGAAPGTAYAVKSEVKKMRESQTMPPRDLKNARNAAYNSSVSMPPTRLPSSEKMESQNGEHYSSSETYSGEIQVEDPSLNEKQVLASHLVPASGILSTPDYSKDPPKQDVKSLASEPPMYKKQDNHRLPAEEGLFPVTSKSREGATGSPSGSMSFSFSGVARSGEASDDDETQSVISDVSVSVGKYRVKGRLSPILQSIFDKYGDIAASCHLESIAMRSYYLECVCFVVQELQITQFMHLRQSKTKEMLAILKDVEASGIDVAWLRSVLRENAETIELIGQHQAIEEAKTNCDRELELAKKKLESQMENLSLKEQEIGDAKKLIAETRAHLRELELKSSVLSETVSSIKSKVETLDGKSLLDGVL